MRDGLPAKIAGLSLALAALIRSTPALAHGEPVPFTFWGGFGSRTAACQRAISFAAQACFAAASAARLECEASEVKGTACDRDALALRISAARSAARSRVRAFCSDASAATLLFSSADEAATDVSDHCVVAEKAAVTAGFFPATGRPAEDSPDPDCLVPTAKVFRRYFSSALRHVRSVFDRVASGRYSTGEKQRLLELLEGRLERLQRLAARRAEAACRDRFADVYGRSAAELVQALRGRVECQAAALYVHDAVSCPPPECGNGITEPGEQCDDGNRAGGDSCPSSCRF